MIAFNHAERGDLPDATYDVKDGAIIIGGGLASIDVAKIHTLDMTIAARKKRGIETNVEELEIKGIPKILEKHGLSWEELGIKGPTIYYRRRIEDMPLMSAPEGADEARIEKVEAGRTANAREEHRASTCSRSSRCRRPRRLIVEDGRLVGHRLSSHQDRERPRRPAATKPSRSAVRRSSARSVRSRRRFAGIVMNGELFDFKDWDIGRLEGYPTVFSVGNVVTGKGNIVASRKHATQVSEAGDRGLSRRR